MVNPIQASVTIILLLYSLSRVPKVAVVLLPVVVAAKSIVWPRWQIITKTKPLLRAVYAMELRNPTNHAPLFLMYPVSSNWKEGCIWMNILIWVSLVRPHRATVSHWRITTSPLTCRKIQLLVQVAVWMLLFVSCVAVRAISLPIMEKMRLADAISKMPLSTILQPDGGWMKHWLSMAYRTSRHNGVSLLKVWTCLTMPRVLMVMVLCLVEIMLLSTTYC